MQLWLFVPEGADIRVKDRGWRRFDARRMSGDEFSSPPDGGMVLTTNFFDFAQMNRTPGGRV